MKTNLRGSQHSEQLPLSLTIACRRIIRDLVPLAPETLPLESVLGRIPAKSVKSTLPKPSFSQSTRDGYAINDSLSQNRNKTVFRLIGEVAAGSASTPTVLPGQAVRIMTGAPLPAACNRVVPFEFCREEKGKVVIPGSMQSSDSYIRHRGQDLSVGRVIAGRGKRLSPDQLLLLAESGYTSVEVTRQPGVAVLCTGSELVYPGQEPLQGQKISGNGVLLKGLIEEAGGICTQVGTVADTAGKLSAALEDILAAKPDLILTTGGMGPGKFDLFEEVFVRLGGKIVYNSLLVRPGKSTLYGYLSGVPLFALPGPPPAVRLLFHELVAPGLSKLQGMRRPLAPLVRARLLKSVPMGKGRHLNLKGGVAVLEQGALCVRPAGRQDTVSAILHLSGRKSSFSVNESVPIRLTRDFQ